MDIKKKIVRLAVLRSDKEDSCPFGLSIPVCCENAGDLTKKMAPIEILGAEANDKEKQELALANNRLYTWKNPEKRCEHAGKFFKKNEDLVNCTWDELASDMPKGGIPAGSPFYAKHFSGIGLDGLHSWPLGGYRDNSIDRGHYYGTYSVESTGSEEQNNIEKAAREGEPTNKTQYNRKLLSFRDLGMKLTKKSTIEMAEFADMPETAIDGQTGWSTDGFSLPVGESDVDLYIDDADLYVDDEEDLYVDDEYDSDMLDASALDSDMLDASALEGELSGEVTIQVGDEEPTKKEYDFEMSLVPGGEYQDSLEDLAEFSVKEPEDSVEAAEDPWSYTVPTFLDWLQKRVVGVPGHSGKGSAGCERAISYLNVLDGHISKAVRQDVNNVLDINAIEDARESILKGIKRLEERLDKIKSSLYSKKKKKSSDEPGLVKEAKAAGFTVVVPLFISSMARTCINSTISAGKDIEDCFDIISKKYDLTDREQAELIQLLADMGYSIRRPRGHLLDEEIDYTSTDNLDWAANYHA